MCPMYVCCHSIYPHSLKPHFDDFRTLSDRVGEAKASGNLGNTLKVLGKYEEAIACCLRHLEIARDLGDRVSFVCYYL